MGSAGSVVNFVLDAVIDAIKDQLDAGSVISAISSAS